MKYLHSFSCSLCRPAHKTDEVFPILGSLTQWLAECEPSPPWTYKSNVTVECKELCPQTKDPPWMKRPWTSHSVACLRGVGGAWLSISETPQDFSGRRMGCWVGPPTEGLPCHRWLCMPPRNEGNVSLLQPGMKENNWHEVSPWLWVDFRTFKTLTEVLKCNISRFPGQVGNYLIIIKYTNKEINNSIKLN